MFLAVNVPFQPNRCTGTTVDLPLLSVEEPASTPLQRHYCKCDPSGASPLQHDHRVPTVPTGPASNLSLCRRHLPGRGQLGCLEGIIGDEPESLARDRARWADHIRDHGTVALALWFIMRK